MSCRSPDGLVYRTADWQAGGQQGLAFFGNYGFVDIAAGDTSILATANRPRIIQFALKLNF
jgi:hypothetical protein